MTVKRFPTSNHLQPQNRNSRSRVNQHAEREWMRSGCGSQINLRLETVQLGKQPSCITGSSKDWELTPPSDPGKGKKWRAPTSGRVSDRH